MTPLNLAVIGLSLSSSWGNGHATSYRSLLRELHRRGHRITFFERDVPWYASHRDLPDPSFCDLVFYSGLDELEDHLRERAGHFDAVIQGSYVPESNELTWRLLGVVSDLSSFVFYDIDTPVTLALLEKGACEYLSPDAILFFGAYLSFSGGPALSILRERHGCKLPVAFYCTADVHALPTTPVEPRFDLGYLGTYSADRQPGLEELLLEPARRLPSHRFAVVGPQYPASIRWPSNVVRVEHLPPSEHPNFYQQQRFTLNLTREAMKRTGWSPSVRLFEAAAQATPVISDYWEGLDDVFAIGSEILVAESADAVIAALQHTTAGDRDRLRHAAHQRYLDAHSPHHRATQLEDILARLIHPQPARL